MVPRKGIAVDPVLHVRDNSVVSINDLDLSALSTKDHHRVQSPRKGPDSILRARSPFPGHRREGSLGSIGVSGSGSDIVTVISTSRPKSPPRAERARSPAPTVGARGHRRNLSTGSNGFSVTSNGTKISGILREGRLSPSPARRFSPPPGRFSPSAGNPGVQARAVSATKIKIRDDDDESSLESIGVIEGFREAPDEDSLSTVTGVTGAQSVVTTATAARRRVRWDRSVKSGRGCDTSNLHRMIDNFADMMLRNASRLDKVTASLGNRIEGLGTRCGMGRGGGGAGGGCAACEPDANLGSLSDGSEGVGGGGCGGCKTAKCGVRLGFNDGLDGGLFLLKDSKNSKSSKSSKSSTKPSKASKSSSSSKRKKGRKTVTSLDGMMSSNDDDDDDNDDHDSDADSEKEKEEIRRAVLETRDAIKESRDAIRESRDAILGSFEEMRESRQCFEESREAVNELRDAAVSAANAIERENRRRSRKEEEELRLWGRRLEIEDDPLANRNRGRGVEMSLSEEGSVEVIAVEDRNRAVSPGRRRQQSVSPGRRKHSSSKSLRASAHNAEVSIDNGEYASAEEDPFSASMHANQRSPRPRGIATAGSGTQTDSPQMATSATFSPLSRAQHASRSKRGTQTDSPLSPSSRAQHASRSKGSGFGRANAADDDRYSPSPARRASRSKSPVITRRNKDKKYRQMNVGVTRTAAPSSTKANGKTPAEGAPTPKTSNKAPPAKSDKNAKSEHLSLSISKNKKKASSKKGVQQVQKRKKKNISRLVIGGLVTSMKNPVRFVSKGVSRNVRKHPKVPKSILSITSPPEDYRHGQSRGGRDGARY